MSGKMVGLWKHAPSPLEYWKGPVMKTQVKLLTRFPGSWKHSRGMLAEDSSGGNTPKV